MRREEDDGFVEFRPSITAVSMHLAQSAVLVVLMAAIMAWIEAVPTWVVATAIAGALLVFGISFIMPWLQTVRVRPGVLQAPAGYGDNVLKLDRIRMAHCHRDALGNATLVDDLGSRITLRANLLAAEEIDEILVIFGIDPGALDDTRALA